MRARVALSTATCSGRLSAALRFSSAACACPTRARASMHCSSSTGVAMVKSGSPLFTWAPGCTARLASLSPSMGPIRARSPST